MLSSLHCPFCGTSLDEDNVQHNADGHKVAQGLYMRVSGDNDPTAFQPGAVLGRNASRLLLRADELD